MYRKENNLKTSFSYTGHNVKQNKIVYLWQFEGPLVGGGGGAFNDHTGPILLSSYPLTHIYVNMI